MKRFFAKLFSSRPRSDTPDKTARDSKPNGPLFIYPGETNAPALAAAHAKAKASLPEFAASLRKPRPGGACYNVKVHFPQPNGEEGAHIWLAVNELFDDMYFCSPRELPKDFDQLKPDESLILTDERIEDWMILADGVLYGGHSLRVLRELLPPEKRSEFDEHVGVREYRSGAL